MAQPAPMAQAAPVAEPATPVAAPRTSRAGMALDVWNTLMRVIAVVASCVPLVFGLVAVAKVDWSFDGFGSPPVEVARMTFSPWIAVITAAIGLVGVLAAASVYRQTKLLIGTLMAVAGLVVLLAEPTIDHVVLNHRFGLMLFIPGLVVAATGLLMRRRAVVAERTAVPV